jgi:kumamolisin
MKEMKYVELNPRRSDKRFVGATKPIKIVVELRRKKELPPIEEGPITIQELEREYGAFDEDIELVKRFAVQNRVQTEVHQGARLIILRGELANIQKIFHVQVLSVLKRGVAVRYPVGPDLIPEELQGKVLSVVGFDERPQIKPHRKRALASGPALKPIEIANRFGLNQGDGKGAKIVLCQFGGGYDIEDVRLALEQQSIASPMNITFNSPTGLLLQGGRGTFFDEVALNLQICASVAPQAEIIVNVTGQSDADIMLNIVSAVRMAPTAISISWGFPESAGKRSLCEAVDRYLQEAALLGAACLVSSGNDGSGLSSLQAAYFPASSTFATACGGMQMQNADLTGEPSVWNDGTLASGGGKSQFFQTPQGPRGVPDLSGYASLRPGYRILLGGSQKAQGCTSAVAPLYAAFFAGVAGDKLLPPLNPFLYSNPRIFVDIKNGSSSHLAATRPGFTAGPGWDAATGLGYLDGKEAAKALKKVLRPRP